jgi:hypothetical protein
MHVLSRTSEHSIPQAADAPISPFLSLFLIRDKQIKKLACPTVSCVPVSHHCAIIVLRSLTSTGST